MAEHGGSAVAHKAVSEAEREELPFEEAPVIDVIERKYRQKTPRGWLTPLVIGTGVGIAIAFGGMSLLSQGPAAQNPSQAPGMSVTSLRSPCQC